MSRAKKARARERRLAAAAPPQPPAPKPRIEASKRRVRIAKAGVVGLAIVGFAGAFAVSRSSYAGHSKKPLRPLAAPPRYVQIVRQNLLQAGIVAPAQAPPGAATATS
ncbi:MAG: hypothetical protein ACYDCH_15620 [Gaiellaceae bacterium]